MVKNSLKSRKEDDRLVVEFMNGNTDAFNELHKKYIEQLNRFCYTYVKDYDIACDVAQTCLITAYKALKRGRYTCKQTYHSWLFKLAYNACTNHFRDINRSKKIPTIDNRKIKTDIIEQIHDQSYKTPEELLIRKEFETYVDQLIPKIVGTLSRSQQTMVNLRMVENMTFKEIATKQKISINTALAQMRYALINLRKELEKKEYEEINDYKHEKM